MTHQPVDRRAFIADLGKGMVAAIVLAACSPEPSTEATSQSTGTRGSSSAGEAAVTVPPSTGPLASTSDSSTGASSTDSFDWARVDLGFVSAYLLVRSGEAVLVDTGVADSEGAIEAVLGQLGLHWGAVGNVIITHEHPDHQGSARAVLELASDAKGYAAQPDLANIAAPRSLVEVTDGDIVEGLQVIATPGHTAGHISLLDPGRILLVGDALNNVDGTLTGPNAQFSSDMPTALDSARMLASFDYDVALFGHGSPLDGGAAEAVAELARSL